MCILPDYLTCSYQEAKKTFLNYSSQTAAGQLEFMKNQANAGIIECLEQSAHARFPESYF